MRGKKKKKKFTAHITIPSQFPTDNIVKPSPTLLKHEVVMC